MKRSVLESPGATDLSLRTAAFSGTDVPEDWAKYVRKVRDESYKVTAKDIGELSAKGYSEDMIFEVTVAAALGAAATRLEAGLRNLSERS